VHVPTLLTLPIRDPVKQKSSVFVQLKHDHADALPRSFILRGIHPSEALRAPVIKVEIEQAIARSELYSESRVVSDRETNSVIALEPSP
jgi:hypothetical protein